MDIGAGDTKFEISGASRATGASKLKLADFPIDQADVTLSRASEATIEVSGRLAVILTGASRLYYKGDPMIGSIMVSDTSAIERK